MNDGGLSKKALHHIQFKIIETGKKVK